MKTQVRGDVRQPADLSRSELLVQLEAALALLVATCRGTPDASLRVTDVWTLRDVLAHILFWHASFARNVSDLARGRTPTPLEGGFAVLNQRGVDAASGLAPEQLIRRLRSAQRTIARHVLSSQLDRIPYRKGSRDYTPEEHLRIVRDHILGHVKSIERARRQSWRRRAQPQTGR
jgi:Mycothiol maleylpyruvate isomerase N-terminal domain